MNLTGKVINGRYKIQEMIAETRMSYLYLAYDQEGPRSPAAVKFLKNSAMSRRIEDVIRFRFEIAVVSGLEHENIVRILDSGEVYEMHFLVMEYVTGGSLADLLAGGKLSLDLAADYMMQLCRAVEFIHNNRIIHRDLKPANVLVTDGKLKLIDFGLARVREFNDSLGPDEIVGTFGYLSPEQCGALDREVDERSDLYSLGVIFYQMLTGVSPFRGDDVCSVVHQQIARIPDRPSLLGPEISPALDGVVLKLLEKEPENRYQGARGLLLDLEKIRSGQHDFVPGTGDKFPRLRFRTRLVGRDRELDLLRESYRNALKGSGSLCLVSGEAGMGKTRLVEELKNYVHSQDGVVIGGRCTAQADSVPYSAFREALNSYAAVFSGYSEAKQGRIRSEMAERFKGLGRIITDFSPGMKDVLVDPPPLEDLDPDKENRRFFMAAGQFFRALAQVEKGVVIVLEDLQRGDEGTFLLLEEIMEKIPRNPLLLVGTYRHDEVQADHGIVRLIKGISARSAESEEVPVLSEVRLSPFDPERTSKFVSGLLHASEADTAEIAGFILKKSGGNPLFAVMIMRQLFEERILESRAEGWRLDADRLEGVDISESLVELLMGRIARLNDRENRILTYAAAAGRKVDPELLIRLSGWEAEEVVRIVDRAVALKILEAPDRGKIRFAHDRIREAFYKNIDPQRRRDIHLAIAGTIEEQCGGDTEGAVFELAYHYLEAGNWEKALLYTYPAGLRAKKNWANEEAARYFNRTLELYAALGLANDARWMDCKSELAEIYLITGRYDTAIHLFREILPLMSEATGKARIFKEMSNGYYRKGDWHNAEKYFEQGLLLLGEKVYHGRIRLFLSIALEFGVHLCHVLFPGIFITDREDPQAEKYRLIVGLVEALSMIYVLNNPYKFIRYVLRLLNLAERRLGPSRELSVCLDGFAGLYLSFPRFRRARNYFKKSLALNERLGYEWGRGKSRELLGYLREWEGDYRGGLEEFTASAEIFDRLGDVKELGWALNGFVHCHFYSSDYPMTLETNQRYLEIAGRSGDDYFTSAAYIYFAQYYRETGDLEKAETYAQKANMLSSEKGLWFNYCTSGIEQGCNALEQGRIDDALARFEEIRDFIRKNNFLKAYVVPIYFNLAQARLEDYLVREISLTGREKKVLLKRIGHDCRVALKRTKHWKTHYGSALRVNGLYSALKGKNDRAEAFYLRSIQVCAAAGRRFELARSRYEYGLFLSQRGDKKRSRENLEESYRIFGEIGAGLYRERLEKLLGIKSGGIDLNSIRKLYDSEIVSSINKLSAEISLISSAEERFQSIIARAIELAGARRGFLFLAEKDGGGLSLESMKDVSDSNAVEYSSRIVQNVFAGGVPVITSNAEAELEYSEYQSVAAYGLKSIMCLPIRAGEKTIGVCYMDNALSAGVFSEKDAQLLNIFLAQVAVSIENADLRRRLKSPRDVRQPVTDVMKEKIRGAVAYIEENYRYEISREGLAASLDISTDYLGRLFMSYTGKKIGEYINELRIKDAAKRIRETEDNITDIAYSVGFESLSTFNRVFLKVMKTTPTQHRDADMYD